MATLTIRAMTMKSLMCEAGTHPHADRPMVYISIKKSKLFRNKYLSEVMFPMIFPICYTKITHVFVKKIVF